MKKKKVFKVKGQLYVKQIIAFPATFTIEADSKEEAKKIAEQMDDRIDLVRPANVEIEDSDVYETFNECQAHAVREAIDSLDYDDVVIDPADLIEEE